MSTDFAYAPTNDQLVAVFIGVILFHGLLNTLNTAWLARITSVPPSPPISPPSPMSVVNCVIVVRIPKHRLHIRADNRPFPPPTPKKLSKHSLCKCSQQHRLVKQRLLIPLRIPKCLMGNDRLRCNSPYHRRNVKSCSKSSRRHSFRVRNNLCIGLCVEYCAWSYVWG